MAEGIDRKYLYMEVYESLNAKIRKGEYPVEAFLPSEKEIGKSYGVDRTTVRKALKLLVNNRIVEKKAGVGTRVISSIASPERPKSTFSMSICNSNAIAFFLPTSRTRENRITQPFYSTLFYNVEKICKQEGYQVVYSALDEVDDIRQVLKKGNFKSIMFVSNILRSHIDYALEQRFPCVLINGHYNKLPSVLQDNTEGAYLICRHLISLGHRRIAFIRGIPAYISSIERMRGCLSAMYEYNIPVCKKYILECDWDTGSSSRTVTEFFHKFRTQKFPTAIVAFNDSSAFGAIQALTRLGLRVPEDVSVTGFDNVEQAESFLPGLTTVDTDIPFMASIAVRNLLLQLRDGRTDNVKLVVPVKLIVRDSTLAIKSDE
jgi:LacI family transcriptional regulator